MATRLVWHAACRAGGLTCRVDGVGTKLTLEFGMLGTRLGLAAMRINAVSLRRSTLRQHLRKSDGWGGCPEPFKAALSAAYSNLTGPAVFQYDMRKLQQVT